MPEIPHHVTPLDTRDCPDGEVLLNVTVPLMDPPKIVGVKVTVAGVVVATAHSSLVDHPLGERRGLKGKKVQVLASIADMQAPPRQNAVEHVVTCGSYAKKAPQKQDGSPISVFECNISF